MFSSPSPTSWSRIPLLAQKVSSVYRSLHQELQHALMKQLNSVETTILVYLTDPFKMDPTPNPPQQKRKQPLPASTDPGATRRWSGRSAHGRSQRPGALLLQAPQRPLLRAHWEQHGSRVVVFWDGFGGDWELLLIKTKTTYSRLY